MLVGLAILVLAAFDHLARQSRDKRFSNSARSLWPVIPTAAIMAKAMNPAMRLYSMAVAADSSRRNFPSIHSLSNFDGNGVARSSCRQSKQKRKIARLLELRPGGQRELIAFGRGFCFQTDIV